MTCLILSLLDNPQSALQAKARMQSASTRGVFTINKDKSTLIPLLARTQPHILDRMSSLLLNAGRDFVWNFATAPLNCNKKGRRCSDSHSGKTIIWPFLSKIGVFEFSVLSLVSPVKSLTLAIPNSPIINPFSA